MLKNTKTFLMISVLAGTVAMTAPAPAADEAQSPASQSPAKVDAASDSLTTGTVVRPPPTRDKKLADCMAIWEKATHMTKDQWKRTCNRQLDEEPRP
jgi:hypothetical protein